MSMLENLRKADRLETVSGTPLGDRSLEYRMLYRGAHALACYIFPVSAPTDLAELLEAVEKLPGAPGRS